MITLQIILDDSQYNTLLDAAINAEENGSQYPGMTYEEGIRDFIMAMDPNAGETLAELVASLS